MCFTLQLLDKFLVIIGVLLCYSLHHCPRKILHTIHQWPAKDIRNGLNCKGEYNALQMQILDTLKSNEKSRTRYL